MCQLLGMNSATPTSFSFCFRGFCLRGGGTDIHKDGWGIAIYEGRGLRSFLDCAACARSPVAKFLKEYPTQTCNMIAHIRCATHGVASLENVHPFTRELWGINICFAHNGDCDKFSHQHVGHHVLLGKATNDNLSYHAVGDTDSEAVFCAILNALKAEFGQQLPTLDVLHAFLEQQCAEIVKDDDDVICNFLLAFGENTLFAYSWPGQKEGSSVWNGLYYLVRRQQQQQQQHAPTTSSYATLVDDGFTMDLSHVMSSSPNNNNNNNMSVITTKPLTNEEGWTEMKRGQLLMFDKGLPHWTPCDFEKIEEQGRGLVSRCFTKSTMQSSSC